MMNRVAAVLLAVVMAAGMLTGCGSGSSATESAAGEAVSETSEVKEDAASASGAEEAAGAASASDADETVAVSASGTADEQTETESEAAEPAAAAIEDGTYLAEFTTDSTMFHVNEANDGKGILTVAGGKMTIHVSLVSKSIVNLYPGLAEDAQKDGADLLEPTEDEVTYSDGMTEKVYGFDIPVPALDEEFDCALIGTKGKWYDHKVSVSNPEPYTEE
ncbi:MAG: hypothetical protein IJI10_00180 [Eubacterium sp.]|nr:hypothetical protein [Eubacterium sp.]